MSIKVGSIVKYKGDYVEVVGVELIDNWYVFGWDVELPDGNTVKVTNLSELTEVNVLEELNSKKEDTPLWKQVFNQTTYYNGHGQMELHSLHKDEIAKLLVDLSDNCDSLEDIFHLKLFVEKSLGGVTYWSGSIYQDVDNEDKLWVTINNVILD